MQYDVTIGIPVYNAEKYIRQTMDSVLAQTFPNIEILICDDCGTDSSIEIVEEYQRSHPRGENIRIVRQPKNMGIGEARNRIIDEAKGKYLYYMDADDTIEPNTIEVLYSNACRYEAEIVYGSHERIEAFEGEQKSKVCCLPSMCFLKEDEFAMWAYQKYDNLPAMTWNFLIDVGVYRKNSLKYQSINFWEDFVMTMDLPTYITRAVLLPDITYHYYCRYDSASNFQKRDFIDKSEILKTVNAMERVKQNSFRIIQKPYFPMRMFKVMKTNYFMCQSILKNRQITNPPYTNREIRDIMHSPLSLWDTLTLRRWQFRNAALCVLGLLPPLITVTVMKVQQRVS